VAASAEIAAAAEELAATAEELAAAEEHGAAAGGLVAAAAGDDGLGGKPTLPRWPAGDGTSGEAPTGPLPELSPSEPALCKGDGCGLRRRWAATTSCSRPAGEILRRCLGTTSSSVSVG